MKPGTNDFDSDFVQFKVRLRKGMKVLREYLALKQADVGKLLTDKRGGKARPESKYYGKTEKGAKGLTLQRIFKIAKALNVRISLLFILAEVGVQKRTKWNHKKPRLSYLQSVTAGDIQSCQEQILNAIPALELLTDRAPPDTMGGNRQ